MHIRVGIVGGEIGWRMLLEQEGISHSAVTAEQLDECSALAVSDVYDRAMYNAVRAYVRRGGAVLCSADVFDQITGSRSTKAFVRYLLDDGPRELGSFGLIDVFADCRLHPRAQALRTNHGRRAICVYETPEGGHAVVLPFDPAALVLDRRTATKSFYAPRADRSKIRRRLPFERVSLVARGGIRRIVSRALELLHHRRGLPYVHRWYFPQGLSTIFALRVDTDFASRREIEMLHERIEQRGVSMSWFVDAKSQEKHLAVFADFQHDEIGLHCFDHVVGSTSGQIASDIGKGLEVMAKAGLTPRSFAAPYGFWNEGLARALQQFEFEYSSEFSYDYDNLPSYPTLGEIPTGTLQIPVHPISIGSLRRQGFSEEEMRSYFGWIVEQKMAAREPIVLYHHPKDGHTNVLEATIDDTAQSGIQTFRLVDFARWWKSRLATPLACEIVGSSVRTAIERTQRTDSTLHVTRADGTETFLPECAVIDLGTASWTARPQPSPAPDDVARIRRFNPWIPLIRVEDAFARLAR